MEVTALFAEMDVVPDMYRRLVPKWNPPPVPAIFKLLRTLISDAPEKVAMPPLLIEERSFRYRLAVNVTA